MTTGSTISSASPADVKLIEPLLNKRILARLPERIIYDRAADSDPLRTRLKQRKRKQGSGLGQDSLLSITGLWENVAKQRVLTRMALPYWCGIRCTRDDHVLLSR